MNTKQIIDEMVRTLAARTWSADHKGAFVDFLDGVESVVYPAIRKLIESVAEEMKYIVALHRLSAWSPQDKDLELISKGSKMTADAITDDIDLKVKELLSNLK